MSDLAKVYLVYCDWIPEPDLLKIFASEEAAQEYINNLVRIPQHDLFS